PSISNTKATRITSHMIMTGLLLSWEEREGDEPGAALAVGVVEVVQVVTGFEVGTPEHLRFRIPATGVGQLPGLGVRLAGLVEPTEPLGAAAAQPVTGRHVVQRAFPKDDCRTFAANPLQERPVHLPDGWLLRPLLGEFLLPALRISPEVQDALF